MTQQNQKRETVARTSADFPTTQDKPQVEALAQRLTDHGLTPFLDKWHLIPGEPWQEALEEALDACQTVAVFLGPSGIGSCEQMLIEEKGNMYGRRQQDD